MGKLRISNVQLLGDYLRSSYRRDKQSDYHDRGQRFVGVFREPAALWYLSKQAYKSDHARNDELKLPAEPNIEFTSLVFYCPVRLDGNTQGEKSPQGACILAIEFHPGDIVSTGTS